MDGYAAGKAAPVDPLHDPRVSDLETLQAARTILEERGQDVENLSAAIYGISEGAEE